MILLNRKSYIWLVMDDSSTVSIRTLYYRHESSHATVRWIKCLSIPEVRSVLVLLERSNNMAIPVERHLEEMGSS